MWVTTGKGKNHLFYREFRNILENNKKKVYANLKSRRLYETMQTKYEKSLSRWLSPKEKLRKTDWLINQIAYKLYCLTEAKIKIVEHSQR